MASFKFNVTFEDGTAAGLALMDVVKRCRPSLQLPDRANDEALKPVLEYVGEINRARLPYIDGFLSQVIRDEPISDSIIELWPVNEFIANQSDYAPICNLSTEHRLVQFGSWTGEISDGDGWCIDFQDEQLRCVPVACDDEHGIDYFKRCCYGCFPSLDSLAPYLESVAIRRNWL